MYKYFAAAFSIAFAMTPASALDLGVSVGGVDVGGKVSVDRDGASVGLGANVGGGGEVDAGASVGVDKGGASVGVGGKLGGVGVDAGASVGTGGTSLGASVGTDSNSVGASVGTTGGTSSGTGATGTKGTSGTTGKAGPAKGTSSVGATAGSTTGKTSKAATSQSTGPAVTTVGVVPTKGVQKSVALPRILLPQGGSDRASAVATLEAIPGTPDGMVRACRGAIETAAAPYGAVTVSAKSSGSVRRLKGGMVSAPIHVRIKYQRQGGPEIRQARIKCQLDAAGTVVKLT